MDSLSLEPKSSGDWERYCSMLPLAKEARTVKLKLAIYEALWVEWKETKQIYDPLKVLYFYEQLKDQEAIPADFKQTVYLAFVSRSAHLLSPPLYTDSRSAEFPLVTTLLQRLSQSPPNYMKDILETLFDDVLSLQPALSVVQRLGNFNASSSQFATINFELLGRTAGDFNSSEILLRNLRQFGQNMDQSPPSFKQVLTTAKMVCFHKANNDNDYLYECPKFHHMCTREQSYDRAAFEVLWSHNNTDNRIKFAFKNPYFQNRYLKLDTTVQAGAELSINVLSKEGISWWHVVQVPDGVAIYDAATSSSVICAGKKQWEDGNYVYTRRAEDLEAHLEDCTWIIEDCSDK
ncbi:hypothetical protein KR044_002007 [Drosophila immigrans]|nr:hypothetical protein KR044_002007 [Drosophila immigrans]